MNGGKVMKSFLFSGEMAMTGCLNLPSSMEKHKRGKFVMGFLRQ